MFRRPLALAALLAAFALPTLAQTPRTPTATTPAAPPVATPTAPMTRPTPPAPSSPAPSTPATSTPVPSTTVPSTTVPSTTAARRIDINAAPEAELASLPGIGPVTAKAIIAGRPWDDLAALTAKKVVNQPTFERNKDRFALANINTSSAPDMARTLPGIGKVTAPKIVAGRPYATPEDLVTKKILSQGQYNKIKDLVAF